MLFCSCDLDLDPMTFIYELDLYPLKMCLQAKDELFTSGLSKVIALSHVVNNTNTEDAAYRQIHVKKIYH